MKIVLATGIYPPEIGGPATYARSLAAELVRKGHEVCVVTYGLRTAVTPVDAWIIRRVSRFGGPILRWLRYAAALRRHAADADVVYAFSSVSCALPLVLAHLRKPKKVLRLGGDFLWERYTDAGGSLSLTEWYRTRPRGKFFMSRLLSSLDHLVFSTSFQRDLYVKEYQNLPQSTVIENAFSFDGSLIAHGAHRPFRLLFMGRFVGFKNVSALIEALKELPDVLLTLVGDGPLRETLHRTADRFGVADRVLIVEPLHGAEKSKIFRDHDALVIPSMTEISPNTALEARCEGMPVLLTSETGLSEDLRDGMMIRPMRSPDDITSAVRELIASYDSVAARAAVNPPSRSWAAVCGDHERLFTSLLS